MLKLSGFSPFETQLNKDALKHFFNSEVCVEIKFVCTSWFIHSVVWHDFRSTYLILKVIDNVEN